MPPCTRFAYFTLARDAGFVTLAGVTLMAGLSFHPPLALKAGATVALAFALLLILRSSLLDERRFLRSEAWRYLLPEERPKGGNGFRAARLAMQRLMLRFAKDASGIAVFLYASALLAGVITTGNDDAIVSAVLAEMR